MTTYRFDGKIKQALKSLYKRHKGKKVLGFTSAEIANQMRSSAGKSANSEYIYDAIDPNDNEIEIVSKNVYRLRSATR